jgi:hypothetical protein
MVDNSIVPFGKYKGQPIEVMRADSGYLDWLMAQDWFRNRYGGIYQVIVNNFGEPSETPEHNRLQARFLDDGFCRNVLSALKWEPIVAPAEYIRSCVERRLPHHRSCVEDCEKEVIKNEESIKYAESILLKYGKSHLDRAKVNLEEAKIKLENNKMMVAKCEAIIQQPSSTMNVTIVHREFEVKGWDVCLQVEVNDSVSSVEAHIALFIEIKPSLGDDYPAVLRQIKANAHNMRIGRAAKVLVFDQFACSYVTFDELCKIFSASGIFVLSMDEIESWSVGYDE